MDPSQLQAFIAVADCLSVGQAAERLYISQSAVSKRLAGLEQSLDTRLFDRVGRGLVLNESGRLLYPHAKQILQGIADCRSLLESMKDSVSGRLALATSHHIGLHRLPQCLRHYKKLYPSVDLAIQFQGSEVGYEAVLKGEVELAVITLPDQSGPLLATPLWLDRLIFVTGSEHPLARATAVTLAELSQYPCLLPSEKTVTRELITGAFLQRGLRLRVEMSTNYLETIKMLASIGLGWTLLPHTMLDETLCILPVTELSLTRCLGLVQHPERTLSNAARVMAAVLLEHADLSAA